MNNSHSPDGDNVRCRTCGKSFSAVAGNSATTPWKCPYCFTELAVPKHRDLVFKIRNADLERIGSDLSKNTYDRKARVILDFESVDFLSSDVIGKLMLVQQIAKEYGHSVKLRRLDPEILEVFQITRLDGIFEIE